MTEYKLPEPPAVTEKELNSCRASGDYCPIFFTWYRYVGLLCNLYASIKLNSPSLKKLKPLHYYTLIGLLNRCSRLMLANVALSHEGRFGETTAIIDRCIFESAIKVSWLCLKGNDESFTRYIASGLKTEVEFKKQIEKNIQNRGGTPLVIEARMLTSIDNYILSSKLSEAQIVSAKNMPDMASMLDNLGLGRLLYVIAQRLGSHHVHGTWPDLLTHYLEKDDNGSSFKLRDHDCPTHMNQYVFIPLMILEAMSSFILYVSLDHDVAKPFTERVDFIKNEILKIRSEAAGKDHELVDAI